MHQQNRLRVGIIGRLSLLLLIGFPLWLWMATSRQEQLNADLIVALRTGQIEEAKTLLAQGADPNARDVPEVKAEGLLQKFIEVFTHPRHPEVEQARTALSCATDSKQAAVLVKMLLKKGASIQADARCEQPALSWAARGGDMATVRVLLEYGADVNVRDPVGFTALQGAVLADKPELVQLLLDHGAQVQGGNVAGETSTSLARSAKIRDLLKNASKPKGR